MKIETINEPVYTTQKIQTGTKARVVYISEDGKQFNHEGDCRRHDENFLLTKGVENILVPITDTQYDESLVFLALRAYNASGLSVFSFNYTSDKPTLEAIAKYLSFKIGKYPALENKDYIENEKIWIFSWIESEHSDYPGYQCTAYSKRQLEAAMDNITESLEYLKQLLF